MEINLTRRFAIRPAAVDYIPARLSGEWESNLRVSTGVVFRFL